MFDSTHDGFITRFSPERIIPAAARKWKETHALTHPVTTVSLSGESHQFSQDLIMYQFRVFPV